MESEIDLQHSAREVLPEVIRWRREIHAHPELAFEEHRTATLVANVLEDLGMEVRTGVAGTGVVADLSSGRSGGQAVALRADMDALPVEERTGLPFASSRTIERDGARTPVMHACGHDAHVAMLLGAATVLSRHRELLHRDVRFIFQPAEEIVESGPNGAERMIEEGALDDVAEIYGLHVTQALPSGVVGIRGGATMASVDEITIDVLGRQTHGAYPWRGIDPIVAGSQIVLAIQALIARRVDLTRSPAVVTIGSFHGGVRSNIIPESVRLEGTIRTLDESVRDEIHALLDGAIRSTAEASGAEAAVRIRRGYPVTRNHFSEAAWATRTLRSQLSGESVTEIPPVFGGEDFSFFLEEIPGAFFFLGTRPPERSLTDAVPNHSPFFDVHEPALSSGVVALASLALGAGRRGENGNTPTDSSR